MNLGTAQVIRANARALPLADDSVDLVVTSPPYFALRSYQDGGEHYAGQIGDEPTPAEFVDALLEVTRECVRVLKPSGSLWVNLGDKYAQSASQWQGSRRGGGESSQVSNRHLSANAFMQGAWSDAPDMAARPKSLIGIPWRYALACIDDLGLILRAEVIWSKPNGLPESVTDRVRRSHEQWFCFEQSGGVETAAQSFPFCPLCGRPVDARATLVRRLKESEGGVEPVGMADHVRPDARSDSTDARGGQDDVAVGPFVPPVPSLSERDAEVAQDALGLGQDRLIAAVDSDAENGAALTADEGHGSLAVDEPGEPSGVCECEGHALIVNDEPWLPQSLAAEIMQRVADGEIDPQQAADFLSGDYVRNHSVWFHFTLQPRYFSAVDEIRERHETCPRYDQRATGRVVPGLPAQSNLGAGGSHLTESNYNPLGKLPGSVWTIPTEPLRVPDHLGIDHFAAFPTEWPKRIIQGWSPAGVCVECGEGRRPVSERETVFDKARDQAHAAEIAARGAAHSVMSGGTAKSTLNGVTTRTISGYACACPEPTADTTPAVVLDPFGGTGTTAMVAKALGRHGISVDMSADYCRLAEWRTNDRDQLAKVLGIAKADGPTQDESLFDLLDGGAA